GQKMAFYSLVRQLWVKTLLVLLPRRFHVVRLLFLALGFPFRALLLVKFHGFRTREFGLCIGLLRQNDQSQDVVERRTDKIDRILLIVPRDRKSTRLNSSHVAISYAVFCLKKKSRSQSWHKLR